MSPETICLKQFLRWLNVHSLVYCHTKKICDCFMTDKKWKTQHASREILFSYKNYSIQTLYHALKDLSCDNRVSTGCNLLWCNMKDLSQMQHFWQSDHLFETTTTIIKLFTVQFTLPQTPIIITLGLLIFSNVKNVLSYTPGSLSALVVAPFCGRRTLKLDLRRGFEGHVSESRITLK